MIKSIYIKGLNGHDGYLRYEFNEDLNIITGQNGCGKTTLLKILWYINSGMLVKLEKEIEFELINVNFNNVEILIQKKENNIAAVQINGSTIYDNEKHNLSKFILDRFFLRYNTNIWSSIFFPTFRRIEGGFFMEDSIAEAFSNYSNEMSRGNHKFVSSVSTKDIDNYLRTQYSTISKESVDLQQETFNSIKKSIRSNIDSSDLKAKIVSLIDESEKKVSNLRHPFDVLAETMMEILHHKGIEIDNLIFGDLEGSISSDKLSAGEKQMLSFLCYNAFAKKTIIYIDEPELSLHPDWQRRLMPTLMRQGTGNQYIIATHSPFIYSQYPDKEIEMDNKGE